MQSTCVRDNCRNTTSILNVNFVRLYHIRKFTYPICNLTQNWIFYLLKSFTKCVSEKRSPDIYISLFVINVPINLGIRVFIRFDAHIYLLFLVKLISVLQKMRAHASICYCYFIGIDCIILLLLCLLYIACSQNMLQRNQIMQFAKRNISFSLFDIKSFMRI